MYGPRSRRYKPKPFLFPIKAWTAGLEYNITVLLAAPPFSHISILLLVPGAWRYSLTLRNDPCTVAAMTEFTLITEKIVTVGFLNRKPFDWKGLRCFVVAKTEGVFQVRLSMKTTVFLQNMLHKSNLKTTGRVENSNLWSPNIEALSDISDEWQNLWVFPVWLTAQSQFSFLPAFQEGNWREIARLRRCSWANSPFIEITSRIATKLSCTNFSNRNKCLPVLLYFSLPLVSCQVINCYFLECLWTRLILVTLCTKVFPCTILSFFFPSRNVKRNNPLMLRTRINTLVSTLDNCIFFYMFVIYIDAIIRFSCTLFIVQNLLIL